MDESERKKLRTVWFVRCDEHGENESFNWRVCNKVILEVRVAPTHCVKIIYERPFGIYISLYFTSVGCLVFTFEPIEISIHFSNFPILTHMHPFFLTIRIGFIHHIIG